jgi:hypothetical protein
MDTVKQCLSDKGVQLGIVLVGSSLLSIWLCAVLVHKMSRKNE